MDIYIFLWDKKVATKRRAKGGRARSVVVVASARATTSPHSWVRVGFFFLIFRQKSEEVWGKKPTHE